VRITWAVAALCAGLAAANAARFSPWPAAAALACGRAPCALAVAGWWWGSRRLHALDRSVLLPRVGTAERALVETQETSRAGRFDVRVRALVLRFGALRPHEQVQLRLPAGRAPPRGARLSLVGVVRLPNAPIPGLHVVLKAKSWRRVGMRGGIAGAGDAIERRLAQGSATGLSGERRAVLQAIVVGRTQGLGDGLLADFRASGLYHVLAVDGLKVTTVAAAAAALVLYLGAGRVLAELAALSAIGAYALAAGLRPSVVRAAVAAALASLAWLTARERDRWHALAVGAAALLLWNPAAALDAGFQLSFAAVASIFVVAPRVVRFLAGYPVPRGLAQLIGVSTACGLATAPVTWLQFHQVSVVTIPANVVGVPVVAEMLVLALVTAAVAPVAPPLAAALARVNGWGAWFVAGCARTFGGLPGAQVTTPAGAAAVAAGILVVAAYCWPRGRRRAEARIPPLGERPPEDRAGAAPAA